MKTISKALLVGMALGGITVLSVAQTTPKPAFEVASIKPHLPSDRRPNAVIVHGDRVLITNQTLRQLVLLAYSTRTQPMLDQLLAGDPAWAATERFDIEAKASDDAITMEQSAASAAQPRGASGLALNAEGGWLHGTAMPVSAIAALLQTAVDRPVVDKTGLAGLFDMQVLIMRRENIFLASRAPVAADPNLPPIASVPAANPVFESLQQEMGLRLQPSKGVVNIFVIDSVQRPKGELMLRHTTTILAALLITVTPGARAQSARREFEVASIKLNTSNAPSMGVDADRGRFVATNVPLSILLRYAFDTRLPEDVLLRGQFLFSGPTSLQVIGGPAWITQDHFDIEAKPSAGPRPDQPEMQLMLQSLLEDRFRLKVHREMREVPTYDLVVAKEGKLKTSSDDKAPPSATPQGEKLPPLPRGRISTFVIGQPKLPLVHTMYGHAIPISALALTLASWAERPVTDKTNLNGLFDVVLQFSGRQPTSTVIQQASPPADPEGPSIFTAIQQRTCDLRPDRTNLALGFR